MSGRSFDDAELVGWEAATGPAGAPGLPDSGLGAWAHAATTKAPTISVRTFNDVDGSPGVLTACLGPGHRIGFATDSTACRRPAAGRGRCRWRSGGWRGPVHLSGPRSSASRQGPVVRASGWTRARRCLTP